MGKNKTGKCEAHTGRWKDPAGQRDLITNVNRQMEGEEEKRLYTGQKSGGSNERK